MQISARTAPVAGEAFQFDVTDAAAPVRIRATLKNAALFEEECPDPPCHEIVDIPPGTNGMVLTVFAIDQHGEIAHAEFLIRDKDGREENKNQWGDAVLVGSGRGST